MLKRRWFEEEEARVRATILFVRLLFLCVTVFVSIVSVPVPNWPAFILSVAGFYLAVLDPLLRRPRLVVSAETPAWTPDDEKDRPETLASQVIRLKITNYGQSPARNCIGRLIEVRTIDGRHVQRFDPFTLYWSRQNDQTGFNPVNIQGYGDFYFLDVAQVPSPDGRYDFRVVLEPAASPTLDGSQPEGAKLEPGLYFVRIGIYAEGVRIAPIWFKLCPPGQLERADPPRTDG